MASSVVISGVREYDGRYPLDIVAAGFTVLEWGWIRRLADYYPMTIADGYRKADAELYCAFAVIAMVRAGKVAEADVFDAFEVLRRQPFDSTVNVERDAEEAKGDADPPAGSSSENSSSSSHTSGDGSTTSSESSGPPRRATGTRDLATSGSGPPTSAG